MYRSDVERLVINSLLIALTLRGYIHVYTADFMRGTIFRDSGKHTLIKIIG